MNSPHFSETPVVRIRPPKRWPGVDLGELWSYRDLVLILGIRDLKIRYRQTALGAIWIVMQPVLAAGAFTFVFSGVAKLPSEGAPYFLISYVGMLAWNAFNNTMTRTSSSLVSNPQLVSKVYFARLALPISVVVATLIDFLVGAALLVVLLPATGTSPTLALLLLPVWLVPLISLALGIGLVAGASMVRYRDVASLLALASQLLLYLSPIAYTSAAIPAGYRTAFFLNPVAALIDAFRWSALGTHAPSGGRVAYAVTVAIVSVVAGSIVFKRMERGFADVI